MSKLIKVGEKFTEAIFYPHTLEVDTPLNKILKHETKIKSSSIDTSLPLIKNIIISNSSHHLEQKK